jgi:PKHD-type hydroxylase
MSSPEDYEGGELLIYDGNTTYTANKKYGSITFFDSRMLHEVTPVTSGFRKSIVGWILGPRV